MEQSRTFNLNFNFGTDSNPIDDLSEAVNCLQKSTLQQFDNAINVHGLNYDASQVAIAMAPSGTVLVTAPTKKASSILAFVQRSKCECSSPLKSGLYEMVFVKKTPTLYFFSPQEGKIKVFLKPTEPGTAEFSTPLGNDMCGKAPSTIQDYCQRFVACAAYDLFC